MAFLLAESVPVGKENLHRVTVRQRHANGHWVLGTGV